MLYLSEIEENFIKNPSRKTLTKSCIVEFMKHCRNAKCISKSEALVLLKLDNMNECFLPTEEIETVITIDTITCIMQYSDEDYDFKYKIKTHMQLKLDLKTHHEN